MRRLTETYTWLFAPLLFNLTGCVTSRVIVDSASGVRLESRSALDIRVDPQLAKKGDEWVVTGYIVPLSNTFGYDSGHLHASVIDAQGQTQELALVSYAPQLFRLKGARYSSFAWHPRGVLTSGSTVRLEYATDRHPTRRVQ